jgi:hypothetical protein
VAFDGRESVQLLGVSSSALFRSGSVPNSHKMVKISLSLQNKEFLPVPKFQIGFINVKDKRSKISHFLREFCTRFLDRQIIHLVEHFLVSDSEVRTSAWPLSVNIMGETGSILICDIYSIYGEKWSTS